MPSNNKALLLETMSDAINDLELTFHEASVADRIELRPKIEDLLQKYAGFRLQMLEDSESVTADDVDHMDQIKSQIDEAAKKQQIIAAIAKTAAFIATKVAV
jgi:hypothetical protein